MRISDWSSDVCSSDLLREGPHGPGMVQAWAEPDVEQLPVDIVARDVLPEGYLHVFDAVGPDDEPVSLIHEDTVPLRLMAVFDEIGRESCMGRVCQFV